MKNALYQAHVIVCFCLTLISLSCEKNGAETSSDAPPKGDTSKTEITLSPLAHLVSEDELLKDSIWKDGITHTLELKVGPKFLLHNLYKESIYPGAILSKNVFPIGKQTPINSIDKKTITLNFPNKSGISLVPDYNTFRHILKSYTSSFTGFDRSGFDNGREFSRYGDLMVVNGYENAPIENWLQITNKQNRIKRSGIIISFKSVDFTATVNIPNAKELIDRDLYFSRIDSDTLCYIHQINIGKRAFLTFMCDSSFTNAQQILTKLKNNRSLNAEEAKILEKGEVGYFMQGYGDIDINSNNNIDIIKQFFEVVQNIKKAGVPIEFFLRNLKDLSPYTSKADVNVIRK